MSSIRQLSWTQNEAGSWWARTETVGTYFVNRGRWWIKDVTRLIDAGSDDEAKRWAQIDFDTRISWGIAEGAKLIPPGHIQMPANIDEAKVMVLLGERWLKDNAPDQLQETVTMMSPTEMILTQDENSLIGLVMRLTGGSANPNVVKGQIERIRKEKACETTSSPS